MNQQKIKIFAFVPDFNHEVMLTNFMNELTLFIYIEQNRKRNRRTKNNNNQKKKKFK